MPPDACSLADTGFPKLNDIIREICGYVEGLEVEYTACPFVGNVVDPRNTKHGNKIAIENAHFFQGIPKRPFTVEGIYVVGGQARYLPERYHTGQHDLDMVVKTNADKVSSSIIVSRGIWINLSEVLEDGRGEYFLDHRLKYEFLDLFPEDDDIHPPYLQIYPLVRKVRYR